MRTKLFIISIAMLIFSGCDVAKQTLSSTYNLLSCKYAYNSISGISLSGIDFSSGLSAANLLRATSLLTGNTSSIPLSFTLNLDVSNPNTTSAALSGMDYILSIDDVQFTSGSMSQSFTVPGGGTNVLPLGISFDLASMLKGDSKNAVVNITKNFLGIGSEKSNVTLQIRPKIMIGTAELPSSYIPVSFAFGGK